MKSVGILVVWLVLAALGAIGLADALQPVLPLPTPYGWLTPAAVVMVALPGYLLLRYKRVHWPTLYIAAAVVAVFAGSLLLVRADAVTEGSALLAMGISIFVATLLRGYRSV
jgi:hypothetical protein